MECLHVNHSLTTQSGDTVNDSVVDIKLFQPHGFSIRSVCSQLVESFEVDLSIHWLPRRAFFLETRHETIVTHKSVDIEQSN